MTSIEHRTKLRARITDLEATQEELLRKLARAEEVMKAAAEGLLALKTENDKYRKVLITHGLLGIANGQLLS